MDLPPMVMDEAHFDAVQPETMDRLWAEGWRHFGPEFFRYSISLGGDELRVIQPLRMDLAAFQPSRSQRRVLRKNVDAVVQIRPVQLEPEVCRMFQRHKQRFTSNVPENLAVFLGAEPGRVIDCFEFQVHCQDALIAVSFLDAGKESVSSVYALFEPEESHRSLGIFTMLAEINWARQRGYRYYYPGYATRESSHYDYKKQFSALSYYDWLSETWLPLKRATAPD